MEVPQKLKTELLYGPAIPLLNNDFKTYLYSYVHSSIIHNSEKVEATKIPIDGWMDQRNVGYTYTIEYYSTLKW